MTEESAIYHKRNQIIYIIKQVLFQIKRIIYRFRSSLLLSSSSSTTRARLDLAGKGARVPLVVPLLYPGVGAQRVERLLEVVAGLVVSAANLLAPVVVQVALVAVPGLVRVRETRIERNRRA